MEKLRYLLLFALIAFFTSISFDAIVMSSYWISPNPQFTFIIGGATEADVFIFSLPDEDLVFTEVEGILLNGTVEGTIQKCDSNGLGCSTLITNLVFDGGRDTFTTFTSSTLAANETLKWITDSASSAGYLAVTLRYFPTGS